MNTIVNCAHFWRSVGADSYYKKYVKYRNVLIAVLVLKGTGSELLLKATPVYLYITVLGTFVYSLRLTNYAFKFKWNQQQQKYIYNIKEIYI